MDSPIASPTPAAARSRLLQDLARITTGLPVTRKRFIGPDINYGRELLTALARETGGWIGWEAANLRGIAEELAFVPLAQRGIRAGNDVEIGALINQALDEAIADGAVGPSFVALRGSAGFRRAVQDSLLELRTAGIDIGALRSGTAKGSPAHDLPAVLERYERRLASHALTDPAGIFAAALDAFDQEAPFVLDGTMHIAPTLPVRGLPGRLLAKLIAHGARVLDADPVFGIDAPDRLIAGTTTDANHSESQCSAFAWLEAAALPADDPRLEPSAIATDFFVASTPGEELRELCRRVAGEGLTWDSVEIVATDVDSYGVALDALCQQLDMRATMLHGIPLARTRLGRALDRWLRWLESGLPADMLRQALEAGEMAAPDADLLPTALAREQRRLRIGWGRARYENAQERLRDRATESVERRDDETDEEHVARVEARRRGDDGIARLLVALLAATPTVPELGSDAVVRTSAAALARHTLQWLALVPLHDAAEQQTAARVTTRLEQLAAIDEELIPFSSALAGLREALADLRAWPLLTSERKPWSASGGMVHLTDLAHAGTTGRPRVFVVGLDAGRAPGGGRQDPLLPDATRQAIGADALMTLTARRREGGWLAAQSLASLRGRVTLSYAISGALDGRESGPAPILLQAWRVHRRDASQSYENLRDALGAPACAVPVATVEHEDAAHCSPAMDAPPASAAVDARDAWLGAIADGPLLLDATSLIRRAFPTLAQGLRALELAAGAAITPYHGIVPAAAVQGALGDTLQISPSALEKLAACPLAWFYRYGLALRPPDDPAYDAERWLLPTDRGSLLHEVFEEFVTLYLGRQPEIAHDAARAAMLSIVERRIAKWREQEPPPGVAVFLAESAELKSAALSFLAMERERAEAGDRGVWMRTELGFGAESPAGRFTLADGTVITMKGKADRVDAMPDGTLRVVDYKTGSSKRYRPNPRTGAFNGGRQLQPALYAAVVSALLSQRVARFEYRFPTERGENEVVPYTEAELDRSREIIAGLLRHLHDGHFVPTNDHADCTYCEYGSICRATPGQYSTTSPRAEWAESNGADLEQYRTMLRRRSPEASA